MIYRHDWVMMQIQMMTQFVVLLVQGQHTSQNDELMERLRSLLARGAYGAAEDELFRMADPCNLPVLFTGLWFYRALAELSPKELKQGDFSQQEVLQGMEDFARLYGILIPEIGEEG